MKRANPEAQRLQKIFAVLAARYPQVGPALAHRNPWELLVATVLSAQCTDARVNQVTPELFRRYPSPAALAAAEVAEVEAVIRSIGLYRNKARHLVALAGALANGHRSRVPEERAALEALPGVGRKTASVVLGQAFGIPAFPVDTHVGRVCQRLGLAASREPRVVEQAVTRLLPEEQWNQGHLLFIYHGRGTCTARAPRCGTCPLDDLCPWPGKA